MQAACAACPLDRQQDRTGQGLAQVVQDGGFAGTYVRGNISQAQSARHTGRGSPLGAVQGGWQAERIIALRTPALASGRVHIGAERRKA